MNHNELGTKPLEEFIGTETCSYCDALTECLSLPVDEDTERFACRDCTVQAFAVAIGESIEREKVATEIERMYGPHDRRFKTAIEIADKLRIVKRAEQPTH